MCFVRHAKSSWDHPGVTDFDRPLNARGFADAPMMAGKMRDLGLIGDFILTSGARRALTTAMYFKETFNLPESALVIHNDIYEASAETIFDVVRTAPDEVEFLYVFGHNPAFTWVANSIAGVRIDNVPTCGIVHAQTAISSWKDFRPEYAAFIGFHYPSQYKF